MKRLSVKTAVRHCLLALVAGAGLVAIAGSATAADSRGVERVREQQQDDRGGSGQQQSAPAPQPQRQEQQRAAPQPRFAPPAASQQGGGGGGGQELRRYRGGGNENWRTYDSQGRPAVVGPPRGSQYRGDNARIVPPSQAYVTRPPRTVVPSLPYGHRSYQWRGSNYYYGGGHWYRPYRNSYVIVGAPFGLFVPYLPSYYSTVWVGGTRYYYADGSYYTYANDRRGYIVSRSPYGDDPADDYDDYDSDDRGSSSTTDQDLYIYPMRGQSEQQQSDDRYACHKWAADQTHYDPTDSKFDRQDRSEYDRALTACLTGRGYSVK